MKVWVVETGEYEQRCIFGIWASRDAAIAGIKTRYQDPYRVSWEDRDYGLMGTFESVPRRSIAHQARFDIEAYEVGE